MQDQVLGPTTRRGTAGSRSKGSGLEDGAGLVQNLEPRCCSPGGYLMVLGSGQPERWAEGQWCP